MKKYISIILAFLLICLLLPFAIEWVYDLGDKYPIIHTSYSQGEILGYCATVVGLLISILALLISLKSDDVHLNIRHAITNTDKDLGILIEIKNDSLFDCNISSVELCNKKKRHFAHIVHSPPFSIPAKGIKSFAIDIADIRKVLNCLPDSNNSKSVYYCIRLSLNQTIYLKSNELYEYIKRFDEAENRHKGVN